MGTEEHDWNHLPWWCWAAPLLAAALVVAKLTHIVAPEDLVFVLLAVALLGGAVFAAVHHAEVLAVRIGEPFGSILLPWRSPRWKPASSSLSWLRVRTAVMLWRATPCFPLS